MKRLISGISALLLLTNLAISAEKVTQPSSDGPDDSGPPGGGPGFGGPPPFEQGGPGFFPGGGGPGGFGPFGAARTETKLVTKFDKNSDGWLNKDERQAAREYLKTQPVQRRGGPRGRGGFGRPSDGDTTQTPGPKMTPADVQNFADAPLYGSNVLRTVFLEFEDADWEKEMAEFKNTDVLVPAKMIVDGKEYPDVGVHFHGMSSFMMVSEGQKRSLVIDTDFIHKKQELYGYNKLNLLNAHEDPSFLRSVLALQIARDYIPAPKANLMRVVINGECWGIYANQQHFGKEFTKEAFGSAKGARWKVPGSPNGHGGLNYLGDGVDAYRRIYELKSKDDPKAWASLIKFCKALNETPSEQSEKMIGSMLDVDGALRFFAWDNVLANGDGFWTRASDYDLYLDVEGKFHIVPYDSNETFSAGGGPGGPGGRRGGPGGGPGGMPGGRRVQGMRGFGGPPGMGGGGVKLDPLVSATDASKPLITRLLSVPAWRERYLGYVHGMAEKWLDWQKLGAVASEYHKLIVADVERDTRKLESTEAFMASLEGEEKTQNEGYAFHGPPSISLKNFADQRRAYLLENPEVSKVQPVDPASRLTKN